MTELNNLYSSYLLYPLTETKRYESHIIHMETLVREQDPEVGQRSVLNEESVTRVLRVFLSDKVERGVKLTSLNQLSVILQSKLYQSFVLDHNAYLLGGSTVSCCTLRLVVDFIKKHMAFYLPSCDTRTLRSLLLICSM